MARQHQHRIPVHVPEIRRGDTVVVLSGRDAGKQGEVTQVIRRTASPGALRSAYRRTTPAGGTSVVVEGLNVAKVHTKPRQSAGRTDRMPKIQQGGILDKPLPVPIAKVMLVCPSCHQPTRIRHGVLEDGRRVRVCTHCGKPIEVTA